MDPENGHFSSFWQCAWGEKCIFLSFPFQGANGNHFSHHFHSLLFVSLPNTQKWAENEFENEPKMAQEWLPWTTLNDSDLSRASGGDNVVEQVSHNMVCNHARHWRGCQWVGRKKVNSNDGQARSWLRWGKLYHTQLELEEQKATDSDRDHIWYTRNLNDTQALRLAAVTSPIYRTRSIINLAAQLGGWLRVYYVRFRVCRSAFAHP